MSKEIENQSHTFPDLTHKQNKTYNTIKNDCTRYDGDWSKHKVGISKMVTIIPGGFIIMYIMNYNLVKAMAALRPDDKSLEKKMKYNILMAAIVGIIPIISTILLHVGNVSAFKHWII